MKATVIEHIVLDASAKVRVTQGGYLFAEPRIARSGIQIYRGDEVGRPEMKEVKVFRPPEEVFHKDSLVTFSCIPITNDHPPEMVDAANWRKYAIGQTGEDIARDGEAIRVPLRVMDGQAIKDIQSGKAELSVGYTCDLDWKQGRTNTGEIYDAMQTGIRANHLAVVTAARGGSTLRIGDNGDDQMEIKLTTVTVDGVACQVADATSTVITRTIDKLTADLAAANAKLAQITTDAKTAADAAVASLQKKDAEIATLTQQVKDAAIGPDKLDALVRERGSTIDRARAVLGDGLQAQGKTDADIRRQVVNAKLGDAAKGWTDDMVTASFNTLTAGVSSGGTPANSGGSNFQDVAGAFSRPGWRPDDREKAYQDYNKSIGDAYRTGGMQPPKQ